MKGRRQKSYVASGKDPKRKWFVVDATDRILGRLATRIATVLMGKHKPTYTPFLDTGDFVIVTNAGKVRLTGKKRQTKTYDYYTGFPSGRRVIPFEKMLEKKPEEIVRQAVKRMLPQTTLGRHMFRKLKVYSGPKHPHTAQRPEPLEVRQR